MRILIVEDKPEEQEKARAAAESRGHEVVIVNSLSDALCELHPTEKSGFDGVISDIHFPYRSDKGAEKWSDPNTPCGVGVALACERIGLPFVFCTDGYHHAYKLQWIHTLWQWMGWKERFIEGYTEGMSHEQQLTDAQNKQWLPAVRVLELEINPTPEWEARKRGEM